MDRCKKIFSLNLFPFNEVILAYIKIISTKKKTDKQINIYHHQNLFIIISKKYK